MKYQVATFREAGLQARWSKNAFGAPFISVRNPNARARHQREEWWIVTSEVFEDMESMGIVRAFDKHTTLGQFFSIPV